MIRSFFHNVLLGLGLGVGVATGFSAWATVVRLRAGLAAFSKPGAASYPHVVLFYYFGCAIGGMLIGAFAPLRRWLLGAMFLGFLFVVPIYACFFLVDQSPGQLISSDNVGITLIVSVLGGSAAGVLYWWDGRRGR